MATDPATKPVEAGGPLEEVQLKTLKTKRGNAKRKLTLVIKKSAKFFAIDDTDNEDNAEEILSELNDAFEKFCESHKNYTEQLDDEEELEVSEVYFERVHDEYMKAKEGIEEFIEQTKGLTEDSSDQLEPSEELNSSHRIQELEETLERERNKHKLKMLELQKEAELMKQRMEQKLQLCEHEATIKGEENMYMQRLQQTKEKDTSTPSRDLTSRLSFGISSIGDSSTVLAETLRTMIEESRLQQQTIVNSINTPKIELPKFDGNPLRYWPFIRSFENVVEAKINDNSIRLDTLIQHCTGEVHDLLQCCLLKEPNEGYTLARTLLKDTYGDNEAIASAWLDKILKRPKLKALKDVRTYANDLKTCRETLNTMQYLNELETRGNLRAIAEKLPDHIYDRWVKTNYSIKEREGRPGNLSDMIKFIDRVAKEATDTTFPARDVEKIKKQIHATSVELTDHTNNYSRQRVSPSCPMCKGAHYLNKCNGFRGLSVGERTEFVKNRGLCLNCFHSGHVAETCTYTWVCNIEGCGAKHNRWLHPTTSTDSLTQLSNEPQRPHQETAITKTSNHHLSFTTTRSYHEKVALPIIPILVKGSGRKVRKFYAMLDNGATGSLCTERLVKELGLPYQTSLVSLTTVDRENQMVDCKLVDLEVQDLSESYTFKMHKVMTRESLNISSESYITSAAMNAWPHLADLKVPRAERNQVDLLIGQDHSELLVPLEVRKGKDDEPFAIRTHLGWVVSGSLAAHQAPPRCSVHFVDAQLNHQVEKFWAMDNPLEMGHTSPSLTDRKVISQWESDINYDNKHYSLPIPFKQRPPSLPNNRAMAERRLMSLGKRLSKDKDLKEKYISGIQDALEKGYAEKVVNTNGKPEDGCVWYLPHHPVVHPRKPDKVRVVFDCAAKFRGISLNDSVHQGPDLANKLIGVLLCFRQEPVAIMADIEGMFNQVRVHKEDRDVLRFLWWPDNDFTKEPDIFRMTTHLFGGVWSPSCANFALKRTAEENIENYDIETIRTIDRNFYVDDCLKSMPTEHQAIRLVEQLRSVLSTRGFRLTKFLSNSKKVLKTLPNAERSKTVATLDLDDSILPSERALGVLWNIEGDFFTFDSSVKDNPCTKRGLLSTMSSIYDPMGFVSPFILRAKIIFQSLCRNKIGWDEDIPEELAVQWRRWLDDLPIIATFQIPRCLKNTSFKEPITAQLHHFSDASERGYGAVSYLRLVDKSGQIRCILVMAKSKLAPLKTSTIPRLELAAAVVSVRLDRIIKEHLELVLLDSTYWTDSTIVLQYIRNTDKRFQTFVANRIGEVHSHSEPKQWKHVGTESNPADDISRGMTADELCNSQRWIHGPEFLRCSEDQWPIQPDLDSSNDLTELEIKRQAQIYLTDTLDSNPLDRLIERYSSWHSLKKAVAWMLRLRRILHMKTKDKQAKHLTVDELRSAETAILSYVQQLVFSAEGLQRVDKLSPIVINGTIRVGGRLARAPLPENTRHQIIVPANHHITDLIIRHYHITCAHGGIERTLSEIRQRFWILKGRTAVRRTLHQCITCKRLKAPCQTQMMSDLPTDRVTPFEPPFTNVGVDYFGPIFVKRGRSEQKRYGCIFICLTTRAVHLEVAHSLDTDSFIGALQRFIARRGQPSEIRSDNGTNFVGAKHELAAALKEWNQDQIHESLLRQGINWKFNPPTASHMGGVWERQIRTVRTLMLNLFNQQRLNDESLLTLMCNIESIINSRPITKLSDDPDDPLPLTPNHLLLQRSGQDTPPGRFVQEDTFRRRWRQVQYLADQFWVRWIKEYLPTLQKRHKWLKPSRNITAGDLVLIRGENTPRCQWPLGLVVNVYPGQDGLVRSVKVKCRTGTYERPITKMCLLEASKEQPEEDMRHPHSAEMTQTSHGGRDVVNVTHN